MLYPSDIRTRAAWSCPRRSESAMALLVLQGMAIVSAAFTVASCEFKGHTTYECTTNLDCPGDMWRNGKTCAGDPTASRSREEGECASNADCLADHTVCRFGYCGPGCRTDGECGEGFFCDAQTFSCRPERLSGDIAADGESVYYFSLTSLMKVPRAGGVSTALAPLDSTPSAIAVDDTSVYWTSSPFITNGDGGGKYELHVSEVSRLGGAPMTLVSGITDAFSPFPHSNLAIDDTNIYWTNLGTYVDGGYANGSVTKIPKMGGAQTVLAADQNGPTAIATDGTNVYWTTRSGGGLMKVPRDGGDTTVVAAPDRRGAMGLAIGGGEAYWTSCHAVMRVPVTGGDVVTLEFRTISWAIATDSENVYWMSRPGDVRTSYGLPFFCYFFDATIKKAPLGGGTETVIASGISYSSSFASTMALDATNVYWVDEATNTIMTVSKDGGTPTVLVAPPKAPSWSPRWVPQRCSGQ